MGDDIQPSGGFFEYYQIGRNNGADEADELLRELGAIDDKESTSDDTTERSHSLFGIIFSIQRETGWTHDYILWGESWFNLQLKMHDMTRSKRKNKINQANSFEDL